MLCRVCARIRASFGCAVCAAPLTAEQSARLTAFALEQTGKRFAVFRLVLEVTPLRAHGTLHGHVFGSPRIDRPSWFCSELVVAAMSVAGLIDPHVLKPNTVYPRDLFRRSSVRFETLLGGAAPMDMRTVTRTVAYTRSRRRLVMRARLHSAQVPRMTKVCPLAWNWCCRHTSRMVASMDGL